MTISAITLTLCFEIVWRDALDGNEVEGVVVRAPTHAAPSQRTVFSACGEGRECSQMAKL